MDCASSLHVCTACNWAAVRNIEVSSHMAIFNRQHSDHDTLNQWRVNKASPVVSQPLRVLQDLVHPPLIGECHLLQIWQVHHLLVQTGARCQEPEVLMHQRHDPFLVTGRIANTWTPSIFFQFSASASERAPPWTVQGIDS